MSLHEPKNTLAGQLGRAIHMPRSTASTPLSHVATGLLGWGGVGEAPVPETIAAEFYMLEHAVGVLRRRKAGYERLTDSELGMLELYNSRVADIAVRTYFYLLLICYREMRHCGDKDIVVKQASTLYQIKHYPLTELFVAARDEANVQVVADPLKHYGAGVSVGEFAKALSYGFHKGKFGKQFGGPAWGLIADCVVEFVYGRASAVHMIDMAWALEHNGGCAFNKSFLFSCHKGYVTEVLDLQRAGLIPQAVAAAAKGLQFNSAKYLRPLIKLHKRLRVVVHDAFDEVSFSWKDVVAAGSVGDYTHYGAPKTAKHSPPTPKIKPLAAGQPQTAMLSMWPNFSVPTQTKGPRNGKAA